LTVIHLKHFALDATKVSSAAQAISRNVAASIDNHVTAGEQKYLEKIHYVKSLVI
jgi:hypothetical protein